MLVHDARAIPIGRGVDVGDFDLTGSAQAAVHIVDNDLGVSKIARRAQLNTGVANDGVIAAFSSQWHAVARL